MKFARLGNKLLKVIPFLVSGTKYNRMDSAKSSLNAAVGFFYDSLVERIFCIF